VPVSSLLRLPAVRKGTLLPTAQALLAETLAERGLTGTELAPRLGTSRTHASNLLHGHAPLTVPLAERLAETLGIETGELLDLRHDGVAASMPTEAIPLMPVRILADPTEPMEDWAEP
jgi:transcriptional regulator with XRE-family HTH domain